MAFSESLGNAIIDIRAKTDKLRSDINMATNKVKSAGQQMSRTMKTSSQSMVASLQKARLAIAGVALAVAAIGKSVVTASARIETMRVALESALGSASAANQLLDELKAFSAKTPFQLENIAGASRQLLAAGIEASKVTQQLKILGDISSGANIPLSDMASIFAKIQNKGKAMTEELLQLSDRGIPIIRVLAEQLGVSKDEIFELASQGKLTREVIEDAFKTMTSEGGIFFNQMEKQSDTLAGRWSTLKDNVTLLSAEIGNVLAPAIKGLISLFTTLIQKINSGIQSIKSFFSSAKEENITDPATFFGRGGQGTGVGKKPEAPGKQTVVPAKATPITAPSSGSPNQVQKNIKLSTIKGFEEAGNDTQAYTPMKESIHDAVTTGITGAMQSGDVKSALESFGMNLLNTVVQQLSQAAISGLLGNIGGGSSGIGGGLGGIFGGLFGQRALGGSVGSGKPYLVGERGPELFVPNSRGGIVPNNQMSGGGVNVTMNNNFSGVSAVNRQELRSALKQQEQQIMSSIQKRSRSGGSFAKNLRGE